MQQSKCRIRKWKSYSAVSAVLVALLVINKVEGVLEKSGKTNNQNSTVTQIQSVVSTKKDISVQAAETLQVQREAFLSIILSYLASPEDNPSESQETGQLQRSNDEIPPEDEENNKTAGQSWSEFGDSSLHLRVLRSTSGPEGTALFSRQIRNPPPRVTQQLATSVKSSPPLSQQSNAELAKLLQELTQKRRNQWVDGEAEETSASIEVVQTRTPFTITNGQMIMNDLPMVERRSIPQFGGMVILYTRTSPLRLLYYGNWCGSGGMGPTLDEIDKCCMTHDNCYGDVEKLPCKDLFQKPYTVHYAWRWVEDRKQAYCLRTGDRCAEATCECDRKAAACFSKYMINDKLQGNRLRKNRNRIKPPKYY